MKSMLAFNVFGLFILFLSLTSCVSPIQPIKYTTQKNIDGVNVQASVTWYPGDIFAKLPARYGNMMVSLTNKTGNELNAVTAYIGAYNGATKVGDNLFTTMKLKPNQTTVLRQPPMFSLPFNNIKVDGAQVYSNPSTAHENGKIGIFLSKKLDILKLVDGGSAKYGGLKKGDRVVQVDRIDVTGDYESAMFLLTGDKGKPVNIVIEREGVLMEYQLIRQ